MKRKMMAALLAVAMIFCVTGCGSKEVTVENLKDTKVEKYVTLAEYNGMQVTVAAKPEITEQDAKSYLQNQMKDMEEMRSFDGKVKEGSLVNIDYAGSIDGVAFDGGTGQDKMLEIGSGSYINGFEDGLIGVKAGETVTLDLQFPENYFSADLAGKACVFVVTVNYIIKELSDENVGLFDPNYTSAQAYIADTRQMLEDYVIYQYDYSLKNAVAKKLVESCTYKEIPQTLINSFKEDLRADLESAAAANGMSGDDYIMNRYGVKSTEIETTIWSLAEGCAKEGLALQAIANAEDLNVSDEELDKELNAYVAQAGYSSVDAYLEEVGSKEKARLNLLYDKVYTFLVDHARVQEQ